MAESNKLKVAGRQLKRKEKQVRRKNYGGIKAHGGMEAREKGKKRTKGERRCKGGMLLKSKPRVETRGYNNVVPKRDKKREHSTVPKERWK